MKNKNYAFLFGSLLLGLLLVAIVIVFRPAIAAPPGQDQTPSLAIKKTAIGDGTISPGQVIQFNILVTSVPITGTEVITAEDVTVQDDFDQAVFPRIDILEGDGLVAQNNGDVITWQLGSIGPGETITVSYKATAADTFPPELLRVTNMASVFSRGVKIGQDKMTLIVPPPRPWLATTRKVERLQGEGVLAAGDALRISIQYSNNGTASATNVSVEDKIYDDAIERRDKISAGGQSVGSVTRWNIGDLLPEANGEVFYEVTLKSYVPEGKIKSGTTIIGDGLQPRSFQGSIDVKNPELKIVEIKHEDLNGGSIEPGDRLRFTIRFQNIGTVPATGVVVKSVYDVHVVATVSNISGGGSEVDGTVQWALAEPLLKKEEMTVSYELELKGQIKDKTDAVNNAFILINDKQVANAQTTIIVESTALAPEDKYFLAVVALAGVLGGGAMATLAYGVIQSIKKVESQVEKEVQRCLWYLIQGVAITLIIEAVLILAVFKEGGIQEEGAVGILSGIAGYVLGRATTTT